MNCGITTRKPAAAAIGPVALVLALLVPTPGVAAINGPCSASINGRSVKRLSLASADAIHIRRKSTMVVKMAAGRRMTHYTITVSFGDLSWKIKDARIKAKHWVGAIPVARYSQSGPGVYKVTGTSTGPGLRCSGAALIRVR